MEEDLDRLNRAGVRYLVAGGVAVVSHGHLRTTLDLDLVVERKAGNLLRGHQALAGLGYRPHAPVPIASRQDLIARKRSAGRPQDPTGGTPARGTGGARSAGDSVEPAERLRWLEESADWARSVAGTARPPAQER